MTERWYNPRTMSEAAFSIARGYGFHSTRLSLKADRIFVASFGLGMRNERALTRDVFGLSILESARRYGERYRATNRWEAEADTDVVYWVARDGYALALMRRDGSWSINPEAPTNRRTANAVAMIRPALDEYAARRNELNRKGIEVD